MNRILTTEIWHEAKKLARTASSRKLAVAYVTADHIGLRMGDVLVTDASPRSIRSGQTDAKLLAKLHKAGVVIYSREGLHSKVMLIGKYAVVGSANMSESGLTEAAVLSDEPTIRSGVASFIAQLCTKKSRLDDQAIAALCKIEVVRNGWPKGKPKKPIRVRRLGNATWIVGVYDLKRDPTDDEQKHIDRATTEINERLGAEAEEYDWIRWGKKGKFAKECRVGDTLIHVYNPKSGRGRTITRRRAVLLKRTEPNWIRIYLSEETKDSHEVNWSRFQRVLRAADYQRKVKPGSVQRLEPEMARAIDRKWTRVK
ncbi:hypothetical protein XI06_05540 [Bradyrhizobium sp. CCBAU 11434]|uniref:phospholipase D family protein n=1 Tax=Bradyrhizobium sp. CCBAU 11434 TaxID=1630885 RepID=UPI0023050AB1|nr:phospholipase D family protein [Bradyrhizobium sp. CCBAU 11434]MDA9519833.1 hypothetical protein [Bradyrhizobium sp. CCBAU 11434]